ncbi:hypothetical protein UAW_03014 [Enterococcus haemoperoxidus ATCC BAA-382]|uniref:OmpR/PhoB-type domain-containing protein n=1 Tax=Enterococcus haemoperoxidus ATCC BAA-382 TaxID=1158608 RepID=R2SWS8_9ENTE|nr:winged helix-turn-helix domain-containing protein [Enterococcus haemoperoxidus]EOH92494.1 hypothetical protein UAW_03014 [Enterococcus haemoperoxidus ATCC BAA-382]EOT61715.1 hypothetical protein I583_00697 [Enterococcus haemoperoxidus ATCC BAA-382]OJG51819.1 hypothetical protein RV06_GL001511 [Enterococcus haemoperoxidus]
MYTIGFFALETTKKSAHVEFLTEKGWDIVSLTEDQFSIDVNKFDALVIQEEAMPVTCRWLMEITRQVSELPIYLLSTNGGKYSNIVYLQLGVDACFPFEIDQEEFFYTLTNLLMSCDKTRKFVDEGHTTMYSLKSAGLELVASNLSVVIDGEEEIILTRKEFQAMELLYNNPCRAIPYEEFKEKMWNPEQNEPEKNYRIANVVFHLRNKIEQNPMNPRFIKTVRSKGYMLDIK